MHKMIVVLMDSAEAGLITSVAGAGEVAQRPSSPPLPFHTVEGTSGVFLTDTAYFANLPEGDHWLGLPSLSISGVMLRHKHLEALSVTTNLFKRVELGYALEHLTLGNWPRDVRRATGLSVSRDSVTLNTVNSRLMLVKEGDWDLKWLPAVTAGLRYKHNHGIWDIDRDLIGCCKHIGVENNDGWDATLTASKTFVGILPKPIILSAGLRSTKAAQTGFLGFADDRSTVFEGSAVFFLTDRLSVGGEYRQKPDELDRVPGLVGREDHWWDLALGYIANDRLTVCAGYANLGSVLNHDEDNVWAVQIKFEF